MLFLPITAVDGDFQKILLLFKELLLCSKKEAFKLVFNVTVWDGTQKTNLNQGFPKILLRRIEY
jgi:hypothetical protein